MHGKITTAQAMCWPRGSKKNFVDKSRHIQDGMLFHCGKVKKATYLQFALLFSECIVLPNQAWDFPFDSITF